MVLFIVAMILVCGLGNIGCDPADFPQAQSGIQPASTSSCWPSQVMTATVAEVVAHNNPATVSQTIAGRIGQDFGGIVVDATAARRDIEVWSLVQVIETTNGAMPTMLTNLQMFKGTAPLNTGSAIANPSTSAVLVVFDQPVYVPHGTVATFATKANVSAAAPVGAKFSLRNAGVVAFEAGGGPLVPVAIDRTTAGNTVTVVRSGLALGTDTSSPSYQQVAGGTVNVLATVVKFRATSENVRLQRLYLALVSGSTSSIVQGTVWLGSAQVGSVTWTGVSTRATCTLDSPVDIPDGQDVPMIVRVDVAPIGVNQPGRSGELIRLTVIGADAIGLESGESVTATGSAESMGFRTYKSVSTISLDSLPTQGATDGRLMRFKVAANPLGSIGLAKLSFRVNTTGCSTSGFSLTMYGDPGYAITVGSGVFKATGATPTSSGLVEILGEPTINAAAGTQMFFELRANVAPSGVDYSVVTTLLGETAPLPPAGMSSAPEVDGHGGRFIWTPNSLFQSGLVDLDWTNGFGVLGLPSSGLAQVRTN
ncbi:MAG: hypothetical protein WC764_00945 [Candidatus Paceibacterota bacterium]|jgi:hypothetical protein